MDWPPQSPDLNINECGHLDRKWNKSIQRIQRAQVVLKIKAGPSYSVFASYTRFPFLIQHVPLPLFLIFQARHRVCTKF